MTQVPTLTDGREDFDFLYGRWHIRNRRLADVLDQECTEWVEFEATGEAHPVLGGIGNVDSFSVPALPDGTPYEGMTLRLFDPELDVWRIWWVSTRRPGHLGSPVEGGFTDGHGRFFGDDVLNGQPVKVRFEWKDITATSANWQQSFSYDDGLNWNTNWRMAFTRAKVTPGR